MLVPTTIFKSGFFPRSSRSLADLHSSQDGRSYLHGHRYRDQDRSRHFVRPPTLPAPLVPTFPLSLPLSVTFSPFRSRPRSPQISSNIALDADSPYSHRVWVSKEIIDRTRTVEHTLTSGTSSHSIVDGEIARLRGAEMASQRSFRRRRRRSPLISWKRQLRPPLSSLSSIAPSSARVKDFKPAPLTRRRRPSMFKPPLQLKPPRRRATDLWSTNLRYTVTSARCASGGSPLATRSGPTCRISR